MAVGPSRSHRGSPRPPRSPISCRPAGPSCSPRSRISASGTSSSGCRRTVASTCAWSPPTTRPRSSPRPTAPTWCGSNPSPIRSWSWPTCPRSPAAARERGAITVVDSTFATPLRQRPLDLGADIVLHSATKFIGGHSDLLLGAAVCRDDAPRGLPCRSTATTTARSREASRRSSRCAGCGRSRSGSTGPKPQPAELARRLAAHPQRLDGPLPRPARRPAARTRVARPAGRLRGRCSSFEVAGTVEQTDDFLVAPAARHPRDQPRRRGVADRASRALRGRRRRRRSRRSVACRSASRTSRTSGPTSTDALRAVFS